MTGERAESDYTPERDPGLAEIKAQLDEITEHVQPASNPTESS